MSNLVVVAIPAEDDYVWKISSEKIPHMTLLFLGDSVPNVPRVSEFIGHACNIMLNRFGMEVDRRDTLGVDEADVLMFSLDKWSGFQGIDEFRNALLKDTNILTAYNNTQQFDVPDQSKGWLPHLTLGYPTDPAKPDNRDYPGIGYVSFDKIALWTDDYEGIEYPLKSRSYDTEMCMSTGSRSVESILEHHGIKGMKWGVRRATRVTGPSVPRRVTVKTTSSTKMKTTIRTKGGEGHPAHGDAIKAKRASQKYKKSGSHALSNAELQRIITRANLEQQAARVTPKSATAQLLSGEHFSQKFLRTPQGKQSVAAAKRIALSKPVRKKLAAAAVTAAL